MALWAHNSCGGQEAESALRALVAERGLLDHAAALPSVVGGRHSVALLPFERRAARVLGLHQEAWETQRVQEPVSVPAVVGDTLTADEEQAMATAMAQIEAMNSELDKAKVRGHNCHLLFSSYDHHVIIPGYKAPLVRGLRKGASHRPMAS
jgi:hypothetical protein